MIAFLITLKNMFLLKTKQKNTYIYLSLILLKDLEVNLTAITAYMPNTALGCANARSKPGYICLDERFDRTNPHNVYLVTVTLPSASGNEKMFSES